MHNNGQCHRTAFICLHHSRRSALSVTDFVMPLPSVAWELHICDVTHDCCIDGPSLICMKHNRPIKVLSLKLSCKTSLFCIVFWLCKVKWTACAVWDITGPKSSNVIGCPAFCCVKRFKPIILLALGQCFWYSLLLWNRPEIFLEHFDTILLSRCLVYISVYIMMECSSYCGSIHWFQLPGLTVKRDHYERVQTNWLSPQ